MGRCASDCSSTSSSSSCCEESKCGYPKPVSQTPFIVLTVVELFSYLIWGFIPLLQAFGQTARSLLVMAVLIREEFPYNTMALLLPLILLIFDFFHLDDEHQTTLVLVTVYSYFIITIAFLVGHSISAPPSRRLRCVFIFTGFVLTSISGLFVLLPFTGRLSELSTSEEVRRGLTVACLLLGLALVFLIDVCNLLHSLHERPSCDE